MALSKLVFRVRKNLATRGLALNLSSSLVLLAGCTATATPTPAPPTPVVAAMSTRLPAPTPVETALPSITPTLFPTPTVTPRPTRTPVPSATPTTFSFTKQKDFLPTRRPTNTPTPTPTPGPTRPPAATPTPTPLPPPPTTPTPALTLESWRGEYFANPSLAGAPVLVRNDPNLDFNWILDSPAPGIPADNFTVRWSRLFDFIEAGDYRFWADADDGVKLYVDGWLVIDEWNTERAEVHSGVFADIKPGIHTVVVEYFESGGYARIKVWGEKTTVVQANWVGEYYANPNLQDPATLVREDSAIDFNWGSGSPDASLKGNNFSVRWRRTLYFESGDYHFRAEIAERDAAKIYLDGWLVADGDKEEGGTISGTFRRLGAGLHTLTVEYQEYTGQAKINFNWNKE